LFGESVVNAAVLRICHFVNKCCWLLKFSCVNNRLIVTREHLTIL